MIVPVGSLSLAGNAPSILVSPTVGAGSAAITGTSVTISSGIGMPADGIALSGSIPTLNIGNSGVSIENTNATTYDGKYEICDRSGFKAKPGELVREWSGIWVLPRFYEPRNMQDFTRSRPERQTGSIRPESNRFIEDEYPAGVTADDL